MIGWAVLVLGVVLGGTVLLLLAVFRELAIIRDEVDALARTMVNPPSPLEGRAVPESVSSALSQNGFATEGAVLVAVGGGCSGCEQLLESMLDHSVDRRLIVIVSSRGRSPRLTSRYFTIQDRDDQLFQALEVRVTPTLCVIRDGIVANVRLGADAAWVSAQLRSEVDSLA